MRHRHSSICHFLRHIIHLRPFLSSNVNLLRISIVPCGFTPHLTSFLLHLSGQSTSLAFQHYGPEGRHIEIVLSVRPGKLAISQYLEQRMT